MGNLFAVSGPAVQVTSSTVPTQFSDKIEGVAKVINNNATAGNAKLTDENNDGGHFVPVLGSSSVSIAFGAKSTYALCDTVSMYVLPLYMSKKKEVFSQPFENYDSDIAAMLPHAWYDPSDISTLYQDAGGTVPVTRSGDPVLFMRDKSGNGNNVVANIAFTFKENNNIRWLESNGGFFQTTFVNNLVQPFSRVSGFRVLANANQGLLSCSNDSNSLLFWYNNTLNLISMTAGGVEDFLPRVPPEQNEDFIAFEEYNGASSELIIDEYTPIAATIGTSGADGITIGAQHNGDNVASIRFYGLVAFNRLLSITEKLIARIYMGLKQGRKIGIPQNVFLFAGQSNSRTHGVEIKPSSFVSDPNIKIWNIQNQRWEVYNLGVNSETVAPGQIVWGPEYDFALRYRLDNPDKICYIIKYGVDSSSLAPDLSPDWAPSSGELFTLMATEIASALASLQSHNVNAVCWMQGESDSLVEASALTYKTNLTAFIAAVRSSWSAGSAKFIIGRITDASDWTFRDLVRQAQYDVSISVNNTGIFDTDDFTRQSDNIHYNEYGVGQLGNSFYNNFIEA